MTIGEFRRDKDLVAQWSGMLREHALLRLVLDTMENSHPARMTVQATDTGEITPTMAAVELGKTRGYSLYADRLRLLAQFSQPVTQSMPDTSYAKEEQVVANPT